MLLFGDHRCKLRSLTLSSLHSLLLWISTTATTTTQPYKRRSQALKEARERELAAWQRTLTPEAIKRENAFRAQQRKSGRSRRGNIKDPNAPKKPLSAYFMFLQYVRADPERVRRVFGDEKETTAQSVLAAKHWRGMTDEERKVSHRPYPILFFPFFVAFFLHLSVCALFFVPSLNLLNLLCFSSVSFHEQLASSSPASLESLPHLPLPILSPASRARRPAHAQSVRLGYSTCPIRAQADPASRPVRAAYVVLCLFVAVPLILIP